MPIPFLAPLILSGISAAAGALGHKKQQQTSTTTTTPTIDPAFRGIQDVLIKNAMARLQQPSALPSSFVPMQTAGINHTYDLAGQGLANRLTASGLGTSPIAGAGQRYLQGQRAGDIVRMKQQVPFMERDLQNQDLSSALALLGLGRGSTSTETGTVSGGGGALSGGISGLGSMLGFLAGQGMFQRTQPYQSRIPPGYDTGPIMY